CYHSEHLYGELWHRAFIVAADTPSCNYLISCGNNIEAAGGVVGVWRHSKARVRGMKRVQVEPHLSITGACSAQWVPIRPKTDAAFLYALIHVMLHEAPREQLDLPHLAQRTSSPYLVGPHGYYLRERATRKPLVWDEAAGRAAPHDAPGIREALSASVQVDAVEIGADGDVLGDGLLQGQTAFDKLAAHIAPYTPEWAQGICDVPAATMRRIAHEYLAHACVGQTVEINGKTMPFRPVAVTLGKTVNNGWGGYECCWARTLLATLVGALEVPGGTIGTTVRLVKPMAERHDSVKPGPDGLMDYPFNPTSKAHWSAQPNIRNAYKTMVPLAGNNAWAQALGPTHFSWMFLDATPKGLPKVEPPDVWFVYRTNPAISFWDTPAVGAKIARFPFVVAFAYTRDESNHYADILLPDATDLEGLQLLRLAATKYQEQFWDHEGFALRQPVVKARGQARDFTEICTELARRCGLLEKYNAAINRGTCGVPLKSGYGDFSLDLGLPHTREEIWDAACKSASAELSEGAEVLGLDWWKANGLKTRPFPRDQWYLYPTMVERGLRFEMPYQERLKRVGAELGRRLHESDMHWWDKQLEEYQALPPYKDFPGLWEQRVSALGGQPADYPFWLVTARSMQYAWGGNVGVQMIREVAGNVSGHGGVVMNPAAAERLGIEEGELVEIATPQRATHGHVVLRQGIRPDTLLLVGQFDHWVTPLAKDFGVPSLNTLAEMSLDLTDATGSGADLVRVRVGKAGRAMAQGRAPGRPKPAHIPSGDRPTYPPDGGAR
ncbi:MAG TPA: molybdopterin-dependent oxidoreductase, partial [Rubrivivax sp.]|nr:molybdopterin-dependent oxidoreductase [Rubrivivax sp.]